ncbi:MAG: hypothetical protein ACOX7F_09850 [Eubacteriales bacterium]
MGDPEGGGVTDPPEDPEGGGVTDPPEEPEGGGVTDPPKDPEGGGVTDPPKDPEGGGVTDPPEDPEGGGVTDPPEDPEGGGVTDPPKDPEGGGVTDPPEDPEGGGVTDPPKDPEGGGVTDPPEDPEGGGVTDPPKDPEGGGITAPPEETPVETYRETLQGSIKEGELVHYTTISPEKAEGSLPEGYYPGHLQLNISGTVVVEAGGSLGIGTLSVGGPESSPVITSTDGGVIVVRAGGSLRLVDVVLEPTGKGPLIIQEPGGSVELTDVQVQDGVIQWSLPLVNNLYESPDDIWLEAGTPLSMEALPQTMDVDLQVQGVEERVTVPVIWDLSQYDGRTSGELTLTGNFLDQEGQELCSVLPLEIEIHWYTPEILVVTDAVWKGSSVPTVQLSVPSLPEFAEVWGEVSEDGGKTWVRWEDEASFFIVDQEYEGKVCVFALPDETPRWFRIVAEDRWSHEYWRTETFYLYPEEQEDSEGNRGGSTTPDSPDREPTLPEPETPGQEIPETKPELPLENNLTEGETEREEKTDLPSNSEENIEEQPAADELGKNDQSQKHTQQSDKQRVSASYVFAYDVPMPADSSSEDSAQSDSQALSQHANTKLEEPARQNINISAMDQSEEPKASQKPSAVIQIILIAAGIAICLAVAIMVACAQSLGKKES